MQKKPFYSNITTTRMNRETQAYNSNITKNVDINKLLNRVKNNRKEERKEKIIYAALGFLAITIMSFFILAIK